MEELCRNIIKPKCGRCLREVDSAIARSVVVAGVPGQKLTYKCHGEVQEYEITSDWYERLIAEKRPFEATVFKPVIQRSVPPVQIAREDAILQMREQRKTVAEFVKATIRAVVESQSTYKTKDLALWCRTCSLRLESLYDDVIDHSKDVRRLVMGANTVLGVFELPFFPDETEMTWTPTTTSVKKGKK